MYILHLCIMSILFTIVPASATCFVITVLTYKMNVPIGK